MLANIFRQWFRGTPPAAPADWLRQALQLREAGRHDLAAELCRTVIAVEPENVEAVNFLAAALLASGQKQAGIEQLRRASALAPGDYNAHFTLGNVLATVGDIDGALASFQRAAGLAPDQTPAWIALAHLLKAAGRYDDAEACCRNGLKAAPRNIELLSTQYSVLFEQGRVDDAISMARAVLSLAPANAAAHSDVLRMLNYADGQDPVAVWREHEQWGLRHAAHLADNARPRGTPADLQRRLRVGFVSPYFRRHAVTFFLETVIEHHNAAALEIFLYADVARPDKYSRRLQSYGAVWRKTASLTDEQLAAQIRSDAIDVLIDLSGQTPGHRLLAFARRPAPLQVTWNGYPNTTGMRAIDYRITDAYCDPPGTTEHLHAETLIRMPAIYMTWRIPDDAPPVAALPALASGHITFGSFNACYKLSASVIALWSQLLGRVAGARLSLWTIDGDTARRRIVAQFAAHGIDAARLDLHGRVGHDEFLQAHNAVDIALDAFPYHGTTTTCFSLWMGTPVITLAGAVHASRVGVSLLHNAGMPELVAQTPAQYCDIAASLAGDPAALAKRRASMRDQLCRQPLTDGAAGARNFENAVRKMWADYCNGIEGAKQ